jgi:hypothetical protein
MSTYGRQLLTKTGRDVMVLADLQDAQFKVGGITRDWDTYTAAPAPTTLIDQTPIKTGEKFSRFGQIECEITATGKYGPYDPAANDGRQNLVRGKCFINNRTVKENGHIAELQSGPATDHSQVFDGGTVWKPRLLITSGAHSLAAGPTVTEFEAAFPRIAYAQ